MSCSTREFMDRQNTEIRINFVECLETDVSIYILSFLDDPADLVRMSAVSRLLRQFVIASGLAKQLCLKTFPQLSTIISVVNATEETMNLAEVKTNSLVKEEALERDHNAFASLLHAITKSKVSPKDFIANAVSASSTDRYPNESIVYTLTPSDRFIQRPVYWSSKGQSNPEVPETLIYKLRAGIWVLTEIDIQPFEAFFQPGQPIYSAKSVRFRMGHLKSPREVGSDLQRLPLQKPADDKFVWTYTSPEFTMTQENCLQSFKLPEPVLCNGGYLQIELLGRVQRQEFDDLFYMCVCYVQVLGRPLFPAFELEVLEPNGEMLLKYYPESIDCVLHNSCRNAIPHLRQLEKEMLHERIGLLDDLMHEIQQGPNNAFIWEVDGDDDDEPSVGFLY